MSVSGKLWLCLMVGFFAMLMFGTSLAETDYDSIDSLSGTSAAIEAEVDNVYTHSAGEASADPAFGDSPGVPEDLPGLIDFFKSGKYLAYLILAGAGLILLFTRRINLWIRIGFMLAAFAIFGLESFSIGGTVLGIILATIGGGLI